MTAAQILFGADPVSELGQQFEQSGALRIAREGLASIEASAWAATSREIAAMVAGFCGLDLGSVLRATWQQCHALLDAAAATRSSEDSVTVRLASQRFSVVQRPSIEVVIGEVSLPTIHVELTLLLDLGALSGVVRGGALVELESGQCDITASLRVAGAVVCAKTATVDPALSVPLGGGLVLSLPEQRSPDRAGRPTVG
jgi:hypothetical protein